MALGSKNRDYKTAGRSAEARVRIYMNRTEELVAEGMTKKEASKQAYNEILDGTLSDKVKAEIKRLKDLRNKPANHLTEL